MNAKRMLRNCATARSKLDELEGLLVYIPAEAEANKFVYESLAAVDELHAIAKYETARNVTIEQATHIGQILSRIDHFISLVPRGTQKEWHLTDDNEVDEEDG